MNETQFNVDEVRAQFPALSREANGRRVIYFDGPAGSQVPLRVADRVRDYMLHHNANCHGAFATSRETDAMLDEARAALADLLGASDPDSLYFGPNMTTLTFAFSRALARTWNAGDEIIVTRLDHDANVSPWVLAARDAGVTVRHVEVHHEDCTLDVQDFRAKLNRKTRLVALGCASNAVGSVNPFQQLTTEAHEVGAEVFLDAVHYAPHRRMAVEAWGCDYMACSAYKFFGPHVGVLWGRRERLEELEPFKVRPAGNDLPDRWMTGTQNHEGITGAAEAVDYLADVSGETGGTRRERLDMAFGRIAHHETSLAALLLRRLAEIPEVKILGIADPARCSERLPTFGVLHERLSPAELAGRLAEQGIFVWHGNFYALPLTETLGLEPAGMVRIGLLHYNTEEEIERLAEVLGQVSC